MKVFLIALLALLAKVAVAGNCDSDRCQLFGRTYSKCKDDLSGTCDEECFWFAFRAERQGFQCGCNGCPVAAPTASPVAAPTASPVAAPTASPVAAVPLFGVDFDDYAVGLVSGFDPDSDNIAGDPGDFIGVGSLNNWPDGNGVPFAIVDDTQNGFEADVEAALSPINSDLDNNFFCLADTDFNSPLYVRTWVFNVTSPVSTFSVDMGGTADFPGFSSDTVFKWDVAYGSSPIPVMEAQWVDATITPYSSRPMDSGSESGGTKGGNGLRFVGRNGLNTVSKYLAEDGSLADNTFLDKCPPTGSPGAGKLDTFSVPISGSGNQLFLLLQANIPVNGVVFDNIFFYA